MNMSAVRYRVMQEAARSISMYQRGRNYSTPKHEDLESDLLTVSIVRTTDNL